MGACRYIQKGKDIIDVKWVFTKKNQNFKATLVAKGKEDRHK